MAEEIEDFKDPIDKKSAWETVWKILQTILTLGLNHLIKYLSKKN